VIRLRLGGPDLCVSWG